MQNKVPTSSDYFLWSKSSGQSERLAYYDQNGNYYEKPVPKGLLQEVLKLFDGKPRAVERSSGGYTLVQPTQIVVIDKLGPDGSTHPEIRIRVRFKDLKRNERGEIVGKETTMNTKVVIPSELKDPYSYENWEPQNFVIDFGRGIIPVHVFNYHKDASGQIWASCVRYDELHRIVSEPRGSKISLSIFEVPREVLRIAPRSRDGKKDFETARKHAERLLKRGEAIIPEILKTGEVTQIPTGTSVPIVRQYLKVSAQSATGSEEPLYISIPPVSEDEEDLVPFGAFE